MDSKWLQKLDTSGMQTTNDYGSYYAEKQHLLQIMGEHTPS